MSNIVGRFTARFEQRAFRVGLLHMASGAGDTFPPIEGSIRKKLTARFHPSYLEVLNESRMHNVPKNSETHFKVVVVSTEFDDLKLLARHQAVNKVLEDELKGGVHALSIVAKTPDQWRNSTVVKASPNCMGGSKK